MKKFIVMSAMLAILMSCGGGDSNKEADKKDEKKEDVTDITKNPDYEKGMTLVANSDCLTCHRPHERVQGPAYDEVASKYASYPDTIITHLAKKILRGGNEGIWNMQGTMTPHPQHTQEEAEAMVKYILLLKK